MNQDTEHAQLHQQQLEEQQQLMQGVGQDIPNRQLWDRHAELLVELKQIRKELKARGGIL